MRNKCECIILFVASAIGHVITIFVDSAKDALETVIQTILPFLLFVSIMFTLITETGIGSVIAGGVVNLAESPMKLLLLGVVISFPLISPLVCPGAVIQQILGTLIGGLIASGDIPLALALPAVFAIHQPSGADFIPVGMSLAEAKPQTIEVGLPAILYAKFVIAPMEIGLAILVGQWIFG